MRLNTGYRAEIVRAAIAAAFDRDEKKMEKREHMLARKCWDHVVPPKVRKMLAGLPDGWLVTKEDIEFSIAGLSIALKAERALPIPYTVKCHYSQRIGVIPAGPLADEVQQLMADKEDFKKRRKTAIATLEALVAQAYSTETLVAQWPSGEKYVRDLEKKIPVKPTLPAVRIEELNVMLGLSPI